MNADGAANLLGGTIDRLTAERDAARAIAERLGAHLSAAATANGEICVGCFDALAAWVAARGLPLPEQPPAAGHFGAAESAAIKRFVAGHHSWWLGGDDSDCCEAFDALMQQHPHIITWAQS